MTPVLSRLPLLLAALLVGIPLSVQAGGTATINAMTYKPLPDETAIKVQPLDNSDQNMEIKSRIEAGLRRLGHAVADDAPLSLVFEVSNESGAWTDDGRRTFLELEARGGGLGGNEQQAKLNLFNSTRGGLLNKGEGGTKVVTPYHYRLDFSLERTDTGARLWEAWGTANTEESEVMPALEAMLPVMVDNLGQTVRSKDVTIP